eukprot:scaffold174946_cov26-Tisochrysis_lutea.AAC.1
MERVPAALLMAYVPGTKLADARDALTAGTHKHCPLTKCMHPPNLCHTHSPTASTGAAPSKAVPTHCP